ncbi:MAG TPA: AraC family transcriptional regulator [Agriterribacter sp.]|nr:AraC family transcriptional regulator [Agriterribacter sp.]HRQ50241.1 AraC family transcriptional regulator [Agriterribacter sp.]
MSIPSYRLINPQANRCFVFKWEAFGLTTPWHYHPELELIYFTEGKTTGVIGEGFVEFNEGDLVLLGANFPHVLQEHTQFRKEHPDCEPFGLIIQFTEAFLGDGFFNIPELLPVRLLFNRAKRGIIFNKKTVAKVAPDLSAMHTMNDARKLVCLLDVLTTLSEQRSYEYLTPKDYSYEHTFDEKRMLDINEYVYQHFKEPVSIAEIAQVANMTETSFCRYFKNRTLKTFVRFLNEVRISYASRLLNNDDYSITDACFESGFNSLSYFNRQFKAIMRMSPLQYRKWKSYATN